MKNFLKFSGHAVLFTAIMMEGSFAQNAWINEIHYDNANSDVNESVEVVIEDAESYNLADFSVILYNGGNGSSYNTKTIDQFTAGAVSENYSFYYYVYPTNGIQNGAPDGLALAYQGTIVSGQFLSYEGTFTASSGPANGMLSSDIGVSEPGTDPAGNSLQLSGTGYFYDHFTWMTPAQETLGQLNNNQAFGEPATPEPSNYPADFFAEIVGLVANLSWTDATGGQLPENYLVKASDQDSIINPEDGEMQPDDPDLSDGAGSLNVPYGTQACVFYRLKGEKSYYFKIFPYTNTGAEVNYKTDDDPPELQDSTQYEINGNDFEDGSPGSWDTISIASNKDWAVSYENSAYQTAYSIQIDGYQENTSSNDWLISPPLNLDLFTGEMMEFQSEWSSGNSSEELTLKYSVDYNGSDPLLATWTEMAFGKDTVAGNWALSGIIDLSIINGDNVYIAFQYQSSGTPRRWGIDEIEITGTPVEAAIMVTSPEEGEEWERGSLHDISWTADNNQPNIRIELTTNASSGNPAWTVLNPSVPADAGTWAWDIPQAQAASNDCRIKITDFTSKGEGLSGIFSIIKSTNIPRLVISEIMYNPPESGSDTLEFIELINDDEDSINLEGYNFSAGITFLFPAVVLEPGGYLLLAVDVEKFEAAFNMPAYEYNGSLSNNGEYIELRNCYDIILDSLAFDDIAPWPAKPDGHGPSLTLCDPGLDNAIAANWNVSNELSYINANGDSLFATPGAACIILPQAEFIADITIVTTGSSANFTDLSTGDPYHWVWTFIGGTPGSYNGQNPPPITYNIPGSYKVVLFVENINGTSTEEKPDYILVGDAPVADFSANPTNLYEGGTVNFTNMSSGSPDSWLWEFEGGDPASSNEQDPSGIRYAEPGLWDVTLIVESNFGSDVLLKETYIDVMPVGLKEKSESAFRIYPNPNEGSFRLDNLYHEEMLASIYSAYGHKVAETLIKPGDNLISLADASNGIYVIRFSSLDGMNLGTERLIKH